MQIHVPTLLYFSESQFYRVNLNLALKVIRKRKITPHYLQKLLKVENTKEPLASADMSITENTQKEIDSYSIVTYDP